jgi:glycosyltransferase involved in cell wall biosynthesis
VSFNGPYENDQVIGLMQRCHAVLVPSIWWENSPLVIQEAFAARRPVICSDIGGMAEKVRDGVDGWHFRARSAGSLAEVLRGLAEDPGKILTMKRSGLGIQRPSVSEYAANNALGVRDELSLLSFMNQEE